MNVDLLKRTLAHIEQHPEEWEQTSWHCGTAACFAGHAATLAGARWVDPKADPWGADMDRLVTPEGEHVFVGDYAAEVLGLPHYTHPLFNASNDLDDLRRIVAELCGGIEVRR